MGSRHSGGLRKCKDLCLETPGCSAFNYNDLTTSCALRRCSRPIIPPAKDLDPHYNGYWLPIEPTQSPTLDQDSILLITGGWPTTSTVELFPSVRGCSPPPLPSARSGHKTFITSDPTPLVATCGGYTDGSRTASCLVLDLENQSWDESRMGSLTMPRKYGAVVKLKDIGVFFLGGRDDASRTSDFLATGSLQWQQGPPLPVVMDYFCAVQITNTSFITVNGDEIHEFDAAIAGPTSEEGWRVSTRWGRLQTSRSAYPGCAKVGNKLIITGGSKKGFLKTTEVVDIASRTSSTGGDMAIPRTYFELATISGERRLTTFALGGRTSSDETVDTVEEWEEETSTWKAFGRLSKARRNFGVVAVQKEVICPT